MSETVFRQVMSKERALKIARNKGDWLWNIVFRGKPLTELKLIYIEYVLLELETTATQSILQRFNKKGNIKPSVKKLQMLVNGTTGSVVLVSDLPPIEDKTFTEEDLVQAASFVEEEAVKKAKMLAHKITHRILGGIHVAEVTDYKSVYRPFWVAYYGQFKEGSKVRYITIPADGGKNSRVR